MLIVPAKLLSAASETQRHSASRNDDWAVNHWRSRETQ